MVALDDANKFLRPVCASVRTFADAACIAIKDKSLINDGLDNAMDGMMNHPAHQTVARISSAFSARTQKTDGAAVAHSCPKLSDCAC
ncbi:hypothetical protein ACT691_06830 [Vibrio metschnikovii]